MEITSLNFAGFVALVFIVYHLLPQRFQKTWLLLTSLAFYCTFAWQFAVILLVLTVLNYFIGKRLGDGERRSLLWVGITLNVAALLVFKYADFYLPALTKLLNNLGVETRAGGLQILLPIGLSFYVVQAMAYLIDVYRKRTEPEEDFIDFTLFFVYFPKLRPNRAGAGILAQTEAATGGGQRVIDTEPEPDRFGDGAQNRLRGHADGLDPRGCIHRTIELSGAVPPCVAADLCLRPV